MPTSTITPSEAGVPGALAGAVSLSGVALALIAAYLFARPAPAPAPTPSRPAATAPAPEAAAPEEPTPAPVEAPKAKAPPPAKPVAAAKPPPGPCLLTILPYQLNQERARQDQRRRLAKTATWLKRNPKHKVLVRGFADRPGPALLNLQLSYGRAENATKVLIAGGVASARITTQGLGDFVPMFGTRPDDATNRRVEVWLPGGGCPAGAED